jgi:thymidylate kinase
MTPFVLFSGPDCCGKDTLMHALAKEFNYKFFMCPRSPICNMVYDSVYKRSFDSFRLNLRLISGFLKMGAYFVLIKVHPVELMKRALKRNEIHVNSLEVFKNHSASYDEFFKLCKKEFPLYQLRFIIVDNTNDINKPVETIKNRINRDIKKNEKILIEKVRKTVKKLKKAIENKE